jgi:hypothetical protein
MNSPLSIVNRSFGRLFAGYLVASDQYFGVFPGDLRFKRLLGIVHLKTLSGEIAKHQPRHDLHSPRICIRSHIHSGNGYFVFKEMLVKVIGISYRRDTSRHDSAFSAFAVMNGSAYTA